MEGGGALPERVGERQEGALHGRRRRRRACMVVGAAACLLLDDAAQLRDGAVVADALYLAPKRLVAQALLHEVLGAGRGGRVRRRVRAGVRVRWPKHLEAADVGIFAVQVVAEHAHLQHKYIDGVERPCASLGRGGIELLALQTRRRSKEEVVPALWLDEFAA